MSADSREVAERSRRVEELFHASAEREPAERQAFLLCNCSDDPSMRAEVGSLVAALDDSADFLEAPAYAADWLGVEEQYDLVAPGEFVGSYRVIRKIGAGGMGVVYEAEQEAPRRRVALKVLHDSDGDERRSTLFQREIQALARLKASSIATIYEAGCTEDGKRFFAMELISGRPLNEYVEDRRPSLSERLDLFARICDGVAHAHGQGVIHRDLKPSNILIEDDGHPKIIDFGVAHIIRDPAARITTTLAGKLVGTLAYMCREQARGKTDEGSDVYSLGVILYELLAGKLPFATKERSEFEIIQAIFKEEPPPPSTANPEVDRVLDRISLKAVAREPSERYRSVSALAEDVRTYLRGEPVPHYGSLFTPLRRMIRRHRAGVAIGVLGVLLALTAVFMGRRAEWRERLRVRGEAQRLRYQWEQGKDIDGCLADSRRLCDEHPDVAEACLVYACCRFTVGKRDNRPGYVEDLLADLHDFSNDAGFPGPYIALGKEICQRVADREICADWIGKESDQELRTAEEFYIQSFGTLELPRAREYAEMALQLASEHILALGRLHYLHLQTTDFAGALATAETLSTLTNVPWAWLLEEVRILNRLHDFETALNRCDQAMEAYAAEYDTSGLAVELFRQRAVARLCLAARLEAYDDYKQAVADAIEDLNQAQQRLEPHQTHWIYNLRATLLWITGRRDDAVRDYRHFRGVQGKATFADARAFIILQELSRIDEANGLIRDTLSRVEIPWLESILRCLAGESTPTDLVNTAGRQNKEQICEAYYYAGEACLLQDREDAARGWFRKCVDTGLVLDVDQWPPDLMNEFHLASWRLRLDSR